MEEHTLGPNGGLMYCMEYLLANIEWLEAQLRELETNYVIFDCPGQVRRIGASSRCVVRLHAICPTVQVELYTHHTGFKQILEKISKDLNCRLCSVHLVDSFYCRY
jgi:hypothetical protein